ncbi:MAG: tyrosine-protein phosphatase [Clostridia bacterium]|nr:tyrosine-protein phosphatase [Clostridia bacterium]
MRIFNKNADGIRAVMTRIISLLLALLMLSAAACTQTGTDTESAEDGTTAAAPATDAVTDAETEPPQPSLNGSVKIKPTGDVVYPYIDSVRAYLEAGADAEVGDFIKGTADQHEDIVIEWEYSGEDPVSSFVFECSLDPDFSDCTPVTLSATTLKRRLTNLLKATTYYVRVTAVGEEASASDTLSFSTTSLGPRILNVGGYYGNVRDLGGYVTEDGRTVLQNMVFRGSALDNCVDADHSTLHNIGKKFLNDEVGVKTELDLRSTEENCKRTTAALQSAENYVQVAVVNFQGAFYPEQAGLYRQVFRVFADEKNYPIYFHCAAGADRTGTVAAIILSLLGVSREEVIQDFEITSFSKVGERSKTRLIPVFDNLQRFNGDTMSEKTENYLLSIGLTKQEIYNIKAIMLGLDPDGYKEEKAYELKVREFVYSTAKGADLKLTLFEEAEVSKITLGGGEIPFSRDGKSVTLPAEAVKSAGKGNLAGVMTFADGGSLRFTVIIDEADITDGFNVTHLSPGPSDANYTYVFMSYPCGIFDGVEYHFHSRPDEFPDVEANVLINGVSLQEINKKNMSRYSFAEFPGSSVDRHKVPVSILCQGNTVTLLIHTGWLSEYTGGKDFTITVTKDFAFTNNGVRYYVSRDKTFVRSRSAFKEVK